MNFEDNSKLAVTAPNGTSFMIDLSLANHAESRLTELAYVNKQTAPELMSIFLKAYTNSRDYMCRVKYHYTVAQSLADQRKALILLDLAPLEAQKRGVATKASPSGTEDFRASLVALDAEYQRLVEIGNSLRAAYEWMSGKAKTCELAYQSAKKVYADSGEYGDHELRGGIPEELASNSVVDSVGRARY